MERLRKQALLGFSDEKVIQLARAMGRVADVKAGDYVCFQGDAASPLIMLLSGQLRTCSLSSEGHEIPIRTLNAGESTGAVSIVDDSPIAENVIATQKSTLVLLARADARRLFLEPEVSRALNRSFASLVQGFATRHAEQGMPRAAARVSALINSALSETGKDAPAVIELPSHATLGAMAKVSRETVSRVLASLERRGVIARRGRQISVQDRAALETIAKG
ncbi:MULTISPECIES: Crp/Fnr family transcriptional regulator [Paraburkholderia]|uniref:Crp/Fnr family transcriptional regulator n=1 Tax=Paraburkholderia TaxID=1822464 RepID=UPI000381E785|nr:MULTISPECIES: Crp/Fnr family transcriptional regulator [Paraburkholderia]MDH6147611.1 CRP/FNR family cyclic AMP-dependent transcriptional regulator [Paraburkholderia sp. WSM4179]